MASFFQFEIDLFHVLSNRFLRFVNRRCRFESDAADDRHSRGDAAQHSAMVIALIAAAANRVIVLTTQSLDHVHPRTHFNGPNGVQATEGTHQPNFQAVV